MSWLEDKRIGCWSVVLTMPVRDYLELVKTAHADRGGLGGQRDVLKTTTAKRIRDRMVNDIREGAVLPPVVIGAVVNEEIFASYPRADRQTAKDFLPDPAPDLAIIDGMQRTASLMQTADADPSVLDREMRVEFWLAKSVRAMVYRMLVLNTGQVPWTLSRQLTVVFGPLLQEIKKNVPSIDKVLSAEKPGRRVAPAQYAADDIVELYLAFSLRKTTLDTKEALSEEFSRLDFVENLADDGFQGQFYSMMALLADIDKAFSRFEADGGDRFVKGRNVFDSQPARIGFAVSVAQYVLGRPGQDRPSRERATRMDRIEQAAREMIARLDALNSEQLADFLKLDVLTEILDKRVGQVGRYERAVFFEAFKVLVDDRFEVPNMEPCWRAN